MLAKSLGQVKVRLRDAVGLTVLEQPLDPSDAVLPIAQFKSGFYMLELEGLGWNKRIKLAIQ